MLFRSPSSGLRINVERQFRGFEAGLGYTAARSAGLSRTMSGLESVRRGLASEPFHVVTARLKTDLDFTDTELTAVYRWVSRFAAGPIDPYQQAVEYNDPSLSISVAQNVPTFGAIPAKVQAILDARNLFDQSVGGTHSSLTHSPRLLRGGINIRF
mgnify:CR=1 FL=1